MKQRFKINENPERDEALYAGLQDLVFKAVYDTAEYEIDDEDYSILCISYDGSKLLFKGIDD